MTLPEFLKLLKKTPRRWEMHGNGIRLRLRNGTYACPITVLKNRPATDYLLVARQLGLSRDTQRRIVNAADGVIKDGLCRQIREAVGLNGKL